MGLHADHQRGKPFFFFLCFWIFLQHFKLTSSFPAFRLLCIPLFSCFNVKYTLRRGISPKEYTLVRHKKSSRYGKANRKATLASVDCTTGCYITKWRTKTMKNSRIKRINTYRISAVTEIAPWRGSNLLPQNGNGTRPPPDRASVYVRNKCPTISYDTY